MNTTSFVRLIALGAITGARSMSGAAALARAAHSPLTPVAAALWLGEMVVDKHPAVGNRTDPLPLVGRALLGGLVGGAAAREAGVSRAAGALVGAGTAVVAAHVAMRARQRLPLPRLAGGLVEDAVVGLIAVCCAGPPTVGKARHSFGMRPTRP